MGGSIPIFGLYYKEMYLYANGYVSFNETQFIYRPKGIPFPGLRPPIIAPFLADINTEIGGEITHRYLIPFHRSLIDTEIQEAGFENFASEWAICVTWNNVRFKGANPPGRTKQNRFQMIIAYDQSTTGQAVVVFNYERLDWTTGTNAGGDPSTGLGGNKGMAAMAGWDNADGKTFFSMPGSSTDDVVNLVHGSTHNKRGRWIYKISGDLGKQTVYCLFSCFLMLFR